MQLSCLRIVLLRPRNPENLGAAARAMKNFGVSDWAIVDPRTFDFGAARRVAVHAEELLDRPRLAATLDEAVADATWVVGTSSRTVPGRRRLSVAEVAKGVGELGPGGKLALVFGDERSGLSNDELMRCHAISALSTEPEQPSLNLAQALAIYCARIYEENAGCRVGAGERGAALATLASDAELMEQERALEALLQGGGFLQEGGNARALQELMAPWLRARLTRAEGRLWRSALRATAKRLA